MKRLLTILFLSLAHLAQAQVPQKIGTWYEYKLALFDSLGVPKDTFPVPALLRALPWLAAKADTLYLWSPTASKWGKANASAPVPPTPTISQVLAQSSNGNGYSLTNLALLSATNTEGTLGLIGPSLFLKDYTSTKYIRLTPVASGVTANTTVYVPEAPGDTLATRSDARAATSAAAAASVPLSRAIATGFGLSGGGDLTTNRTLSVDTTSGGLATWNRAYKIKDTLQAQINSNTTAISANTTALANKVGSTLDNNLTVTGTTIATNKSVQTLTDGATITWNVASGYNATVTLAGNRTLAISNVQAGQYLTLRIVQDATGLRTLTLPSGSKVISGGGGAVTLSAMGGGIDLLCAYYDGTNYYWTLGKNYN